MLQTGGYGLLPMVGSWLGATLDLGRKTDPLWEPLGPRENSLLRNRLFCVNTVSIVYTKAAAPVRAEVGLDRLHVHCR
jgi:hypothetical protein